MWGVVGLQIFVWMLGVWGCAIFGLILGAGGREIVGFLRPCRVLRTIFHAVPKRESASHPFSGRELGLPQASLSTFVFAVLEECLAPHNRPGTGLWKIGNRDMVRSTLRCRNMLQKHKDPEISNS